MKGTAPQYGLKVTRDVDERYHVEKATHAACAYLPGVQGRIRNVGTGCRLVQHGQGWCAKGDGRARGGDVLGNCT